MKKETKLHRVAERMVRNLRTAVRTAVYSSTLTSVLRLFVLLFLQIMGNVKSINAWRNKNSQLGKQLFPAWDTNVPGVGIISFLKGQFLCCAMLLTVMMTVGVGSVWADDINDISGRYFIASSGNDDKGSYTYGTPSTNFYLVPAGNPQQTDKTDAYFDRTEEEKPFLTTFQIGLDNEAIWVLEKVNGQNDTYYIKHAATDKYVIYEEFFTDNTFWRRKCLHLVESGDSKPGNEGKFKILYDSTNEYYHMESLGRRSNNRYKFLNVADNNRNHRYGENTKTDNTIGETYYGGLVGLFDKNDDVNSKWKLEPAKCATPTISFNNETNVVTITTTTTGAKIYYTKGDNPGNPSASSFDDTGTPSVTIEDVTDPTTIKAIAVKQYWENSEIETKSITKVATPTISVIEVSGEQKIEITSTPGATIYYTTDESTPDRNSTQYTGPLTFVPSQKIKAFAVIDQYIDSDVKDYTVRTVCTTPTIQDVVYSGVTATVTIDNNDTNGASVYYTVDGSEPTDESTLYEGSFTVSSGCTIRAIAAKKNDDNYNPSSVVEKTVLQVATPVIEIVNNEITISCATDDPKTIYYTVNGGDPVEYTAPLGLTANVSGRTITAYATKSGMLNSVTTVADASTTKLQLPTPTISIPDNTENGNVQFAISESISDEVVYKYTLDGTTNPTNSTTTSCTGLFTLTTPAIIKVIATNEYYETSDVATSTSYVIPTNITMLIQNQGGAWTGGKPFFYLIPDNLNDDGTPKDNVTLTTSSLARNTMGWQFKKAGEGEYYIENTQGGRIYVEDNGSVYVGNFDSNTSDKYKFILNYNETYKGFNIKSKSYQTDSKEWYLNRTGTNTSENAVNLANGTTHANNLWNIVSRSDLDLSLPFTPSDGSSIHYYKLSPQSATTNYIVPPSGTNQNVTTSATANDNMNWYFEEAQAATDTEWLTFYYIRNGVTGDYLYFNGEEMANNNAFEMKGTVSGETGRYMFAVAKSLTKDRWFIVPKPLKDKSYRWICSIYRDGNNNLKTKNIRANNAAIWQFVENLFCNVPKVTPGEGRTLTLSCETTGSAIYYTTDGTDPVIGTSTQYAAESPIDYSATGKILLKAIASVGSGENIATSAIVTYILNPDVTLAAGEIVYDGQQKTPAISSVSILGQDIAASTYSVSYDNNVNAGTAATIILTDNPNDVNYYVNGTTTFTIAPKPVTVSGITASNKTYDGTTDATLVFTGATLTGKLDGDDLTVTATGAFADANVGTGKAVTINGITLEGTSASNYQLAAEGQQTTATANIEAISVTVSGITASNKKYDGTNNATLDCSAATLTGKLDGDDLTVTATGTFENADVGSGKTVTISGWTLGGADAGYYEPAATGNQASTTADITQAPLTITAKDKSIAYGDAPANDGVEYAGFVNGETETVLSGSLEYVYNSALDGSGTAYTATSPRGAYYIIPSGLTSSNYNITFVAGTLTVGLKSIGSGYDLASGFTVSLGEGNSIILKDGETTLVEGTDYTLGTPTTSGRYTITDITGSGNYTNTVSIRFANVTFMSDGSEGATDWSATFVADGDHAKPTTEGISVYIIESIDVTNNTVNLTELDYIPNDVPVLLISNANHSGFLVKNPTSYTEITDAQKSANKLEKSTGQSFEFREIYLLYKNEFVLNKQGTLDAGKIYLKNPSYPYASPARLRFSRAASTGISGMKDDDHTDCLDDRWFTIDGRRLNGKPTKKGLYILNGEKVVIK